MDNKQLHFSFQTIVICEDFVVDLCIVKLKRSTNCETYIFDCSDVLSM